ncbi:MAG TPA: hypothetical protein PK208_13680 [Fibrobacteria bacterium]|nr:hypothetical protein [Fibrobacteria bacterium]
MKMTSAYLKYIKSKNLQLIAALIAVSLVGYLHGLYFTFGGYLILHKILTGIELIIAALATTKLRSVKVFALFYFFFSQALYYVSKSLGEAIYFSPTEDKFIKYFMLGLKDQL